MSERINWNLLDSYLAGEATEAEAARVTTALEGDSEAQRIVEALPEKLAHVEGVPSSAPDPRAKLAQFKANWVSRPNIAAKRGTAGNNPNTAATKIRQPVYMLLAA